MYRENKHSQQGAQETTFYQKSHKICPMNSTPNTQNN